MAKKGMRRKGPARALALLLAVLLLSACAAQEDSGAEGSVTPEAEIPAPQAPPALPEEVSAVEEESTESEEEEIAEVPLEQIALTADEAAALVKPAGGGVWTITDRQELCAFALLVNGMDTDALAARVMLESDIDLTGLEFIPVGSDGTAFFGEFDGGGHILTGLTVRGGDAVGLFGTVGLGGAVRNVHVVDGSVTGGGQVGGIVGLNGGTVEGCSFRGIVEGAGSGVGGICGELKGITEMPDETGAGDDRGAPLAADDAALDQQAGKLLQCAANAEVSGHAHVGGVTGNLGARAEMEDSYALGSVTAIRAPDTGETPNSVGGLCGVVNGSIARCYAAAEVYTRDNAKIVGGFAGLLDLGQINDCHYYAEPVENWKDIGYIVDEAGYDLTACSREEITEQATFAGWDFAGVWAIDAERNRGLPYLRAINS